MTITNSGSNLEWNSLFQNQLILYFRLGGYQSVTRIIHDKEIKVIKIELTFITIVNPFVNTQVIGITTVIDLIV